MTYPSDPADIVTFDPTCFSERALAVFQHQYARNDMYRRYADAIHTNPIGVRAITDIPFLPVSFFKTHQVKTGKWNPAALVFESSGTTGEIPARHFVRSRALYRASLLAGFRTFYGDPADYVILALLPSYLERQNASLVHMTQTLMDCGGHPASGFYLDDFRTLASQIRNLEATGQKTLLLGVTFALLDFAEAFPMPMQSTIVMETGGMKGRREEWTRSQVHAYLKEQWGLSQVHSEYGMTELLSQAYATANGRFRSSNTMRVLVRDLNDPLEVMAEGSGALNIIDLANVDSCAFIATDDVGRVGSDGGFEVLGRLDHAALRGCSLMAP